MVLACTSAVKNCNWWQHCTQWTLQDTTVDITGHYSEHYSGHYRTLQCTLEGHRGRGQPKNTWKIDLEKRMWSRSFKHSWVKMEACHRTETSDLWAWPTCHWEWQTSPLSHQTTREAKQLVHYAAYTLQLSTYDVLPYPTKKYAIATTRVILTLWTLICFVYIFMITR